MRALMRIFAAINLCLLIEFQFSVHAAQSDKAQCSVAMVPEINNWITEKNGRHTGPIPDFFNAIFEDTKHDWFLASPRPWGRYLVELDREQHTAAVPVMDREERRVLYEFSVPIGRVTSHFVSNNRVTLNETIVLSETFKWNDKIDEILKPFDDVLWVENSVRAARLLERGRIKYGLVSNQQTDLRERLSNNPNISFDVLAPVVQNLYMIVRKGSPCLEDIALINAKIASSPLRIH